MRVVKQVLSVGVVIALLGGAGCSAAPEDLNGALSGIGRAAGDLATEGLRFAARGMDLRAEPPTCARVASTIRLQLSPDAPDRPVLACVEQAGNDSVLLKVSANRAYPIVLRLPEEGRVVATSSEGTMQYELWRFLQLRSGETDVFVPAGGFAELELTILEGRSITIDSEPTVEALLVDATVLVVSAVGGEDLRTFRVVLECGYELVRQTILSAEPDDNALEAVVDVVQRCVGLALAGAGARLWAPIRDSIRLGMAARDLYVDGRHGLRTTRIDLSHLAAA